MATSLTVPPILVAETVTQATNITTAVTSNAKAGVITTQTGDVGANQNVTFQFNNSYIAADSVVLACLRVTSATFGTGNPCIQMNGQGAGQVNIVIQNADNQATGANTFEISYIVL